MTEIIVFGPTDERVFEWTDAATGEVHPEHWVTMMFAEARGTDGQIHMQQVVCGIEVHVPGVTEVRKALLRRTLEREMRNKGVWSE